MQVAGGTLLQFAAVVLVAGFPIELATDELEAAFKRGHTRQVVSSLMLTRGISQVRRFQCTSLGCS